jgi:hypothetical protein
MDTHRLAHRGPVARAQPAEVANGFWGENDRENHSG